MTLDGAGNTDSVFIFQTDSSLITATSSTVALINGAQACNVFWQVGSSATLGTGSTFVGNILALTSITVDNNVVVTGRALARNGAVTLDNDVFQLPGCASGPTPTTTSTTTAPSTSAAPTTTAPVAITTVSRGTTTTSELPLTGRSVGPIVAIGVALVALAPVPSAVPGPAADYSAVHLIWN